jgi:hypothetical protein
MHRWMPSKTSSAIGAKRKAQPNAGGEFGQLGVDLDHLLCVDRPPQMRLMLFNIIFLHTILQITKQILTFCLQKRRQGFFELFVGSAERKNEGWASIKGSERCGGGTKKVV